MLFVSAPSAKMMTPCESLKPSASCFYMMLSDADLHAFITAYEQDIGETISLAEAQEMATRVLVFFELLAADPAQDTDAQVP